MGAASSKKETSKLAVLEVSRVNGGLRRMDQFSVTEQYGEGLLLPALGWTA